MNFKIRVVKNSDIKRLREIYSKYINETAISFEYLVPTDENFTNRVNKVLETHPWLVVEVDSIVEGYAYASPHRLRAAYDWSADCSVYLSSEVQGKGLGRELYKKLFEYLEQQNIVNVFAGISLPNDSSVGFHQSLGFQEIGTYKNVGFKFDKWWDVSWYQLSFKSVENPIKFVPFSKL